MKLKDVAVVGRHRVNFKWITAIGYNLRLVKIGHLKSNQLLIFQLNYYRNVIDHFIND